MPDVRRRRGIRHPRPSMRALACCAMLCGARRDRALAEWGRNDGSRGAQALGFTHLPPWAATLHLLFRRLDCAGVEAPLGAGAASVRARMSPGTGKPHAPAPAVALEGTTLRGSRTPGAPGVHLRSALAHQLGVTLAQQAVADKTNAITAVATGLRQVVLTGRVVTMEALLTQTAVAPRIVEAGGDAVMVVKAHHPQLRTDIALILAAPPAGDHHETATIIESGPGRLEPRRWTTRQARSGYRAWPGRAQVFAWERSGSSPKTGEVRSEPVYGVTRLTPQQATPARVLARVRGHGQIEPPSPWRRAVTVDDDRSQGRCGAIPQVMAALRTTTIGLLRWAGDATIAAACRLLAAHPARALALIGIQLVEN